MFIVSIFQAEKTKTNQKVEKINNKSIIAGKLLNLLINIRGSEWVIQKAIIEIIDKILDKSKEADIINLSNRGRLAALNSFSIVTELLIRRMELYFGCDVFKTFNSRINSISAQTVRVTSLAPFYLSS